MTLLLSDPRVAAVPVRDVDQPLVALDPGFGPGKALLARVLCREGLVNYPTEWWHYSFGDRYWALATGAAAALYGPVDE